MNDTEDLEARLRTALVHHAEDIPDKVQRFDREQVTTLRSDGDGPGVAAGRDRRSRWVRAATVAAAAVVLVAGIAAAVGRGGSGDDPVSVAGRPDGDAASVATPSGAGVATVRLDSLDGLFTATSAEFNGPTFANSWFNYWLYASRVGVNRCLKSEGSPYREPLIAQIPVPGGSPGLMVNNSQFPDIAMLKSGTFGTGGSGAATSTTVPTSPPTTVDGLAYAAAVNRCEQSVAGPYRSVNDRTRALVGQFNEGWDRGIDTDRNVAAARTTYGACMAARGITVADGSVTDGSGTDDVFGLADEATRQGDTARVAELAKAYGICFEPVSDAMDSYRLAERTEFYRDHRAALEKLAKDIDAAESRLSEQYGIPRP